MGSVNKSIYRNRPETIETEESISVKYVMEVIDFTEIVAIPDEDLIGTICRLRHQADIGHAAEVAEANRGLVE